MRRIPIVIALLAVFTPTASAAKLKVWHHHAPAHYERAKLSGAAVSSEGAVRLARTLSPLGAVDADHVWAVVEDRAGVLFAATGDGGRIVKVAPDGGTRVAYTADDGQVLCLAAAADGSVYAGTGPNGQVIRLDPSGTATVLHRRPGTYVWSLAVDAKGETIYAGTGPKGEVLRLTPTGKAEVFCATRQEHVLCVATGPDGTLYAGTDKNGLVYRIDGRGKGFVLFSAPQAEVRSLLVADDALYAGTSAPAGRRRPGSASSGSAASLAAAPTAATHSGATPARLASGSVGTPSPEPRDAGKGSPAPAPSLPTSGENSVWRLGFDGGVRELFREKAMVLSLARRDGRLLVGTGMDGQLFEIDEATKERTELARLDHGQVLGLCPLRKGGIVVAAGDPGKLYLLGDRHTARGVVVSEVLDAKMVSRWGALRWRADAPDGTAVTLAMRVGNVADPDDTWSDWTEEMSDPEKVTASLPPARFVQYRATLTTADASRTPTLREVFVRYRNANQAPEVTSLEGPTATDADTPKRLRFKWSATDANEDELTYDLFVRKDGWTDWVRVEEEFEKKEYEWDTTALPSGVYRLKVVASDRRDNAAAEALTHARVGEPFVVSHEPPKVTLKVVKVEDGGAVLEATATDPAARLTSAAFAVNGKKWTNVFPTDGLFDGKAKTFRFKAEATKAGSYVVVLRVRDAAGNVGAADVVFVVAAR